MVKYYKKRSGRKKRYSKRRYNKTKRRYSKRRYSKRKYSKKRYSKKKYSKRRIQKGGMFNRGGRADKEDMPPPAQTWGQLVAGHKPSIRIREIEERLRVINRTLQNKENRASLSSKTRGFRTAVGMKTETQDLKDEKDRLNKELQRLKPESVVEDELASETVEDRPISEFYTDAEVEGGGGDKDDDDDDDDADGADEDDPLPPPPPKRPGL